MIGLAFFFVKNFHLFCNQIPAKLSKWVSEAFNGDPIMAYYHSDVSNKLDYALYYFVNHR